MAGSARTGTKANPVEGKHLLYGFLTTEPNGIVAPVRAEAMPVILHQDDWETWDRLACLRQDPLHHAGADAELPADFENAITAGPQL
jgi:putative SOS response-associated peptidase YedK